MREVLALVLAGGRVEELSVLTGRRPKSAVPFGGQYLVIDFVLTNLVLSGVRRVGGLSQYRPTDLIEHIGGGESWGLWGRERYVKILPPYQGTHTSEWYDGTADAVLQNLDFVSSTPGEHVLVLSGDHIYRMDYRPLLERHVARDADLTCVFTRIPGQTGAPSRFGVPEIDSDGRLIGYEEKPSVARSDLASLTIYLFRKRALIRHLKNNSVCGTTHQLYDEVLPALVAEGRSYGEVFDGYWAYARTVGDYYRAHMETLGDPTLFGSGVLTNEETLGLAWRAPAAFGPRAEVRSSSVVPGAVVDGSVSGSVLGPGVRVEAGAEVVDSVLLPDCVVERGARLERVVSDAGVVFGEGARVGGAGEVPDHGRDGGSLSEGVTLLAQGVVVPPRCVIGRNCTVADGARLTEGGRVEDAGTVSR